MAENPRPCPNCQALVHASEEFCPTCGEWMGMDVDEAEEFDLQGGPPEGDEEAYQAPPVAGPIRCPLCGSENHPSNRHCEQCGARLGTGPLPVAPQPIIQTTAAMRTAMIAAGALIVVVVIAFIVNAIRGDQPDEVAATSTTSTTSTTEPRIGPAVVIRATCSSAYANRPCEHLYDGLPDTDWNAALPDSPDTPLTITLTFDRPYAIAYLEVTNLEASTERFIRNHRADGIRISASDVETPQLASLPDEGGTLPLVVFNTSLSTTLTIEIVSTHPSQPIGEGENVQAGFNDLSIAEIKVFGS